MLLNHFSRDFPFWTALKRCHTIRNKITKSIRIFQLQEHKSRETILESKRESWDPRRNLWNWLYQKSKIVSPDLCSKMEHNSGLETMKTRNMQFVQIKKQQWSTKGLERTEYTSNWSTLTPSDHAHTLPRQFHMHRTLNHQKWSKIKRENTFGISPPSLDSCQVFI